MAILQSMDEILIDEKRYISSKQAAKITGYAKDYIGQLCREGRVPARLVGRSWYVLESAIQDHRFGNSAIESGETEVKNTPSSAFESRYSSPEEVLPSVNQFKARPEVISPEATEEVTGFGGHLQDSWKAWFDRASDIESIVPITRREEEEKEELTPKLEEVQEDEADAEVVVPVRAVHHTLYQPSREELLPIMKKDEVEVTYAPEPISYEPERKKGKRSMMGVIRVFGVIVAVASVILAVIGTGYLDNYLISNSQASLFTGVSLYNK